MRSLHDYTYNKSWFDVQRSAITAKDGTVNVLLGLGYNYNPSNDPTKNNGNLWQQTISRYLVGSWTQTYGYAELGGVGANRLTSAAETGTGSWSQGFLFDAAGKRWVPTTSGLSTTLETAPDQGWYYVNGQTSNRVKGWGYDAAGNVKSVSGMNRGFTFDAENRMITATVNGTTTVFSYDSEGRRVMKVRCPSGVTSCVAGTSGAVWTAFVYDPAGNLAQEYGSGAASATGTQYLVTDALGSTRLVTDGNGVAVRCYDYLPFGEEIPAGTGGRPTGGCFGAAAGPPPGTADVVSEKFTGQERDAETGLDNFIARYFSAAQGRFGSADDPFAGQDAGDPQSWNLFSYVRGNPLRYVDPSGHDCVYANDFKYSGTVKVERGDCTKNGGIFVEGTIDGTSFVYDPNNSQLSFSYTHGEAIGAGTIGGLSPPPDDPLPPGIGTMLGEAGNHASQGVNTGMGVMAMMAGSWACAYMCPQMLLGGALGELGALGLKVGSKSFEILRDATGKLHIDKVPKYIPRGVSRDELELAAHELRGSIQVRQADMLRLGEMGNHGLRIAQEQQLLYRIEERLRQK